MRRRHPTRPRAAVETLDLAIEALGFRGDGIAVHAGERLAVPLALPGERWRVRRRGREKVVEPLQRLVASPDRATPVCRHFGACGGCTLQHLPAGQHDALKTRQITGALRARGLVAPALPPLKKSPLFSRRRLRLGFSDDGRLGLRRRFGKAIVDLAECPIARPELVALLAPLRALIRRLGAARGGGEVVLTALDHGVEAVLQLAAAPGLADREALAGFAQTHGLVRLAIATDGGEPEPLAALRPATLTLAGVPTVLPPAAFIQATAEGEAALQAFLARHLGEARRVLDLFAGAGTLGLVAAERGAAVRGFDTVGALLAATRHPRLATTRRDLFADPLGVEELGWADLVILDPPRAGAEAQAASLARSRVPRIVHASCDPASFARDAAALVAGGYRLAALDAVDQFVFSAEVELIALFERHSPS